MYNGNNDDNDVNNVGVDGMRVKETSIIIQKEK